MTLLFALPGGPEIFIILIVILLLFGGRKLPELMKGFGKGLTEFKKARNEVVKEINNDAIETKEAN